jgi:hypothetical protein
MKTTVEISEPLLAEAKALAAREGTTLRALIERGLRELIRARPGDRPFRLRDGSVGGNGLQSPFREGDWPRIRSTIYGDQIG